MYWLILHGLESFQPEVLLPTPTALPFYGLKPCWKHNTFRTSHAWIVPLSTFTCNVWKAWKVILLSAWTSLGLLTRLWTDLRGREFLHLHEGGELYIAVRGNRCAQREPSTRTEKLSLLEVDICTSHAFSQDRWFVRKVMLPCVRHSPFIIIIQTEKYELGMYEFTGQGHDWIISSCMWSCDWKTNAFHQALGIDLSAISKPRIW